MQPRRSDPAGGRPGSLLVLGILALAVGLASFAVWFQWTQTRRCLAFFGPDVSEAIQGAPRVEAWRLASSGAERRLLATSRTDVSQARGLVHLRHGLVEDSNYTWSPTESGRRPVGSWDVALAFFAVGAAQPRAILAFDLDGEGAVTAVGRPGSVGLGRLGPGFRTWLDGTLPAAARLP